MAQWFVVQDRRYPHPTQAGLRGTVADLRGSEWDPMGRTMLAQCARPLFSLLCIGCLSPCFAMGSHALVPFPCTLHFWHLVGLAPHVVQDTAPGGLVLGAVIAALFHCHVVRRWFRHSHGQLLLICGHCACIVCEVQQAAPCMPHANSDFHAHACACTHGFAHPEHLHCCRFAVIYGLGPMLWDRASWRISSSVVPVRAIACTWPCVGALHYAQLLAPPM